MEAHVLAWLNLVARWVHVIVGIAWIGTSFYFNWLNDQLRPPDSPEEGVGGEVWSVHGGGFYRVTKFVVAPESLPTRLHWFKWEAYATWLSGMVLLVLVYYLNANAYLLDSTVSTVTPATGIAVSLGVLVTGWLVYHGLCRTALVSHTMTFSLLGFGLVTLLAYGLSQWFSSRAAYLLVGATLGTIMAANVFFVIIPSQRAMVDAMAAGREPDAAKGKDAARRSRHNNYLTLPVLFIMVSQHYPMTYGHGLQWAILAGLFVVGVAVRHWFNVRNQDRGVWWLLPVAALALLALVFVTRPSSSTLLGEGPVSDEAVQAIIDRRCSVCHAAEPSYPGIIVPPADIVLDSPEALRTYAERIQAVVVLTETMPLGNVTGMTREERAVLGRWIAQGVGSRE